MNIRDAKFWPDSQFMSECTVLPVKGLNLAISNACFRFTSTALTPIDLVASSRARVKFGAIVRLLIFRWLFVLAFADSTDQASVEL